MKAGIFTITLRNNCPICYEALEVQTVTPCFRCGAWHSLISTPVYEFQLPDGQQLMLCNICYLEEICSDQGDLKQRLNIQHRRELTDSLPRAHSLIDKVCIECGMRLALLNIMRKIHSVNELESFKRVPEPFKKLKNCVQQNKPKLKPNPIQR